MLTTMTTVYESKLTKETQPKHKCLHVSHIQKRVKTYNEEDRHAAINKKNYDRTTAGHMCCISYSTSSYDNKQNHVMINMSHQFFSFTLKEKKSYLHWQAWRVHICFSLQLLMSQKLRKSAYSFSLKSSFINQDFSEPLGRVSLQTETHKRSSWKLNNHFFSHSSFLCLPSLSLFILRQ